VRLWRPRFLSIAVAAGKRLRPRGELTALALLLPVMLPQRHKGETPQAGDEVDINFTGRLFSKQGWHFENTYNQKGPDGFPVPFTFTVGDDGIIAGLSHAVQHMRKGEIARAVVPPLLSYQNRSQGPIPREWSNRRRLYSVVFNDVRRANGEGDTLATVVLDIELMAVRRK